MMFGKNKKQEQFKKIESTEDDEEVPEVNPMEEITKETGKKAKEVYEVVKELPQQIIRQVKLKDGTIVNLITIEEALTEFINQE